MIKNISKLRTRVTCTLLISILGSFMMIIVIFSIYYLKTSKNAAMTTTRITVESLANQIEFYVEDLNAVTMLPYVNTNIMSALSQLVDNNVNESSSKHENKQYLEIEFKRYMQLTNSTVNNFIFISDTDTLFFSKMSGFPFFNSKYPFENTEWYQSIVDADGKAVYIGDHYQDYLTLDQSKNVFSVGRLIKTTYGNKILGVILADADILLLDDLMKGTAIDKNVTIVLLDKDENIISSNAEVSEKIKNKILKADRKDRFLFQNETVNIPIEGTDWNIIAVVNEYGGFSTSLQYFSLFVTAIFVIIVLGLTIFLILSNKIFYPMNQLVLTMKNVEKTGVTVRYKVETNDEVGALGTAFNHMMDRITELMEKEKQNMELLKKTEYYALQSQIEPHFIYNILNNFAGLNKMGQTKLLDESITKLAQYMRYLLSREETVCLSKEIEMLNLYCDLMKLRFGNRLETVFSCDEEFKTVMIPKLMLQPLVENAVVHGLEPSPTGGYVSIVCEEEEGYLQITVCDNGVGFEYEPVQNKNSVVLSSVRDRVAIK